MPRLNWSMHFMTIACFSYLCGCSAVVFGWSVMFKMYESNQMWIQFFTVPV